MTDRPPGPRPDPDDSHGSRRGAMVGLAVVAALVAAAYFLVMELRRTGKMEECLMAGRSNCAPVEPPTSGR